MSPSILGVDFFCGVHCHLISLRFLLCMKALRCIVDRWQMKYKKLHKNFSFLVEEKKAKKSTLSSFVIFLENHPKQILTNYLPTSKQKRNVNLVRIYHYSSIVKGRLSSGACVKNRHVVYWVAMQKWIFLWKTASVAQVCNRTRHGREIWMIYRGPGFLAFLWFGSSPTPSSPFPSASCLSFSVSHCVAGRAYWCERGVGEEPNHTTHWKKEIKFSSCIRKFRRDRVQSHIWLTASQYMNK